MPTTLSRPTFEVRWLLYLPLALTLSNPFFQQYDAFITINSHYLPNCTNHLVFLTETLRVFCEMGDEILNIN
jgi:hypothetical protein